jgi:hypothetical protein
MKYEQRNQGEYYIEETEDTNRKREEDRSV